MAAPFRPENALNNEPLQSIVQSLTKDSLEAPSGSTQIPEDLAHLQEPLFQDLETPVLNELYSNLWLVARRSGTHVDALHVHRIRGRTILPAEDPGLHLVWHSGIIWVKPLPAYLLHHDFWVHFLPESKSTAPKQGCQYLLQNQFDRKTALGFVRSYAMLVQHQLDLTLAQDAYLIPKDLSWAAWCGFIKYFHCLDDEKVSKRYHYGQMRLSRLHWAVRLFRPKSVKTFWFYEIPHWSTEKYVEQVFAPLLFAFATLSLVLSSMQVMLSVPGDDSVSDRGVFSEEGLRVVRVTFWRFSVLVLLLAVIIWSLLVVIPLIGLVWQLQWGYRNRLKPTRMVMDTA